jgi:hypothetical protein
MALIPRQWGTGYRTAERPVVALVGERHHRDGETTERIATMDPGHPAPLVIALSR